MRVEGHGGGGGVGGGNRKQEGGVGEEGRKIRRKGEEWGGKCWTERGNGKGREGGDLNHHFHALKAAIAA